MKFFMYESYEDQIRRMKLSCLICFQNDRKHNPFHTINIMSADLPSFSQDELRRHLDNDHSYDEILDTYIDTHWMLLMTKTRGKKK